MSQKSEYGAGRIQVLEGPEAARKRPAMYIDSTGSRGLPERLREATNPENRILERIAVEGAAAANETFSALTGDAVEPRKQFIADNAPKAEWIDI